MQKSTIDPALRRHIESVGGKYRQLTDTPSFRYYLKRRTRLMQELLCPRINASTVILDLGSGNGDYLQTLPGRKKLICLDLSFNALKASRNEAEDTVPLNADVLRLPLQDGCIDAILLFGMLHHAPDHLAQIFRELARVLRAGGIVLIDEPNGYNLFWFLFMKLNEIDRIGARPLFAHTLKRCARHSGLTLKSSSFWGLVPPFLKGESGVLFFERLSRALERTPLAFVCTRLTMVLEK